MRVPDVKTSAVPSFIPLQAQNPAPKRGWKVKIKGMAIFDGVLLRSWTWVDVVVPRIIIEVWDP
jgi:hypothetical protein